MTEHDTTPRLDVDALLEAGRLTVGPTDLELGEVYAFPASDGSTTVVDLTSSGHLAQLDALAKRNGDAPARKTGSVMLTEAASFSLYVNGHAEGPATSLWGDRDAGRIVAVLNGHEADQSDAGTGGGEAGWGDHRATLALQFTKDWKAWIDASGKLIDQGQFANFVEDHLVNIVEPDAAELLEVVTSIQATVGAAMKSAIRLDTGEVRVAYEETVEAAAGKAGQLTIPTRVTLALTPFEGGEPYRVEARFRYRLNNGNLLLGVVLDRVDDVLRAAFADIVGGVEEETGMTVLYGTPRG